MIAIEPAHRNIPIILLLTFVWLLLKFVKVGQNSTALGKSIKIFEMLSSIQKPQAYHYLCADRAYFDLDNGTWWSKHAAGIDRYSDWKMGRFLYLVDNYLGKPSFITAFFISLWKILLLKSEASDKSYHWYHSWLVKLAADGLQYTIQIGRIWMIKQQWYIINPLITLDYLLK